LTPGVLPLLATVGMRKPIETAGFSHARDVMVKWGQQWRIRSDNAEQRLLVDRGHFDALLLENARNAGAQIMQPACLRQRQCHEDGWLLQIETRGCLS